MEKIKKNSLKTTLFIYLFAFVLLFSILTVLLDYITFEAQQHVWKKYMDIEPYSIVFENYSIYEMLGEIPRIKEEHMTDEDNRITNICDFLQTWTDAILVVIGIAIIVTTFYRHKLKKPIKILFEGVKLISDNDLDFDLKYKKNDELGELCNAFEIMRKALKENNEKLWEMAEDQKMIRQAIIHDIRNPLYVIEGYSDMLTENILNGNTSHSKIISMIENLSRQTLRLEKLFNNLQQISKLEELDILKSETDFVDFMSEISGMTDIMTKNGYCI